MGPPLTEVECSLVPNSVDALLATGHAPRDDCKLQPVTRTQPTSISQGTIPFIWALPCIRQTGAPLRKLRRCAGAVCSGLVQSGEQCQEVVRYRLLDEIVVHH